MDFKLLSGLLATVFATTCFLPYIRDIVRRKTAPHIYSWLVWSILQTVGVIAMLSDNARFGVCRLAVGSVFCTAIFLSCLRYGTKNITKLDTLCLIGALSVIAFWVFQKNAFRSILLITCVDLMGFIPTMRKGYEQPWSETSSLYYLGTISNIFSLLALSRYTPTTVLYLASLIVTNVCCVIILATRRRQLMSKPRAVDSSRLSR